MEATSDRNNVLLDVRNGYEWDVSHFQGSQRPAVDSFRNCSFGVSDKELRLVHVCGATLSKRLVEFENTESSALTEDQDKYREEIMPSADQGTAGISTADLDEGGNDERSKVTDDDGSDNFSDIDDNEVNEYLHSENEKPWKKELWEAANWEYLEEQAAKETAEAALKEAQEANLENCSPEARERYAALLAAMEKSKKEKQQKELQMQKNSTPAHSPAEAVHRMLTKKRLGSKINYDVLEKLFEEPSTNWCKETEK